MTPALLSVDGLDNHVVQLTSSFFEVLETTLEVLNPLRRKGFYHLHGNMGKPLGPMMNNGSLKSGDPRSECCGHLRCGSYDHEIVLLKSLSFSCVCLAARRISWFVRDLQTFH